MQTVVMAPEKSKFTFESNCILLPFYIQVYNANLDTVVLKIIQPPLLFPMTSIETSRATLIVVLTVCFRSIKV